LPPGPDPPPRARRAPRGQASVTGTGRSEGAEPIASNQSRSRACSHLRSCDSCAYWLATRAHVWRPLGGGDPNRPACDRGCLPSSEGSVVTATRSAACTRRCREKDRASGTPSRHSDGRRSGDPQACRDERRALELDFVAIVNGGLDGLSGGRRGFFRQPRVKGVAAPLAAAHVEGTSRASAFLR
jgi:hypothetical protein